MINFQLGLRFLFTNNDNNNNNNNNNNDNNNNNNNNSNNNVFYFFQRVFSIYFAKKTKNFSGEEGENKNEQLFSRRASEIRISQC